jgi:hypothetical protein
MSHFITTYSGGAFDFEEPSPEQINVEDIAVALGNTCRYGGHVNFYYSVAEHAVFTAELVTQAGFTADVALHALHHDDHEAYIGDWPTPLKRAIKAQAPGVYEGLTALADVAIAAALGLDPRWFHHDAVVAADQLTLEYEVVMLKPKGTVLIGGQGRKPPTVAEARHRVWGYPPESAAARFLRAHRQLSDEAALLPPRPAMVDFPTD